MVTGIRYTGFHKQYQETANVDYFYTNNQ